MSPNSKRNREEPCFICNHYHDYYGGEPCSVCGHVKGPVNAEQSFGGGATTEGPVLILNDFLYLGGYDAASRCELLRTLGVSHVLNCVPTQEVLYRTSFISHTVSTNPPPLEECFRFLDSCFQHKQRVLVYCMTGRTRSPTVVVAYLMNLKGWRLQESYRWVKDRWPMVKLCDGDFARLVAAEERLFGTASVTCLAELEGGGTGEQPVNNRFFHHGGASGMTGAGGSQQQPEEPNFVGSRKMEKGVFDSVTAGSVFVFGNNGFRNDGNS